MTGSFSQNKKKKVMHDLERISQPADLKIYIKSPPLNRNV